MEVLWLEGKDRYFNSRDQWSSLYGQKVLLEFQGLSGLRQDFWV